MIESLVVTCLPVLFLALLYGTEFVLRLRRAYSSGAPPIRKDLFLCCKYAIIIPWGVMVMRSWDFSFWSAARPDFLKWPALGLWVFGFALLFSGRLGLGSAFRVGLAREKTPLKTDGAFRFSRNPMYLGIDATLLAAVLYTLNPVAAGFGVFVAAVHHKIILAEEVRLRTVFGEGYCAYCRAVRRYI